MSSTTMKRTMKAAAVAAVAMTIWGMAPGCTPSVASYCNKVCDCTGCSESELDDCVDDLDDARKLAEDEGCASEFDAALSCSNSELVCDDDKVEVDGCDSEAEAVSKCSGKINLGFGKNACQKAADQIIAKYEECGRDVPPIGDGEGGECDPQVGAKATCLAGCFAAASCDCAGLGDAAQCDADSLETYTDCVGGC